MLSAYFKPGAAELNDTPTWLQETIASGATAAQVTSITAATITIKVSGDELSLATQVGKALLADDLYVLSAVDLDLTVQRPTSSELAKTTQSRLETFTEYLVKYHELTQRFFNLVFVSSSPGFQSALTAL